MRTLCISFLLTILSLFSFGQVNSSIDTIPAGRTYHLYRDAGLGIAPVLRYNDTEGTSFAGSFKMRLFISKRISFDSDVVIGKDYLTWGPGMIGIPCWLLLFPIINENESSFSDLIAAAILAGLTAEHIAYHIPLKKYTDLSPYVSLLKIRSYFGDNITGNPALPDSQVCFSIGIELNKYFNRMVISPYAEYNHAYGDRHWFMYTGVYLGFYIFN